MVYIISVIIILLCIVVIIFGMQVFRENQGLREELKQREKGEDKVRF